jgi:exonuclease SbcC
MENFGPFTGRVELDFSAIEEIFLITGKTGAGKTSIFDAICFALYGKVPGSRGNHTERLHSDHAPDGDDCSVTLEFSLGEKRYMAERMPKRERKKKRGEGTVLEDESLALYEISGGEKPERKIVTSKKAEGDMKLKELIGLEAEEFFKIVLLPQGEFAEFLKENTSERQKVLAKLFPVEKAVMVKELARKKAADAEAQVKGAAHILDDISKRINPETWETARAEAAAILEKAGEKALGLEKEEESLGRVLNLRKNEGGAEKRLGESGKSLEETIAAEASIEEKSDTLFRSRSARPLEKFLRGLKTAELGAIAADAAFDEAEKEKNAATAAAIEAEKANAAAPALEKECQALREKRPALAEILEKEESFNSDSKELERQEALTKKLSGEIDILLEELKKQDASIEQNETLAAEQGVLVERLELSKSIKDHFMELRKYRERTDELEKEKLKAERETAELERDSADYEKRVPVLEAELRRLREEKNLEEKKSMAAVLSGSLEDGKPCPVCGSTEHPRPASGGITHFDFDERIRTLEASLMDAEKKLSAVNSSLDAKKRELLKIRDSLGLLENEIRKTRQSFSPLLPPNDTAHSEASIYLGTNAPFPSAEAIEKVIRIEVERLNGLLKAITNSKEAANRAKELYRQRADTQDRKGEAENRFTASEEQKKNLVHRIAEGQERNRKLMALVMPDGQLGQSSFTLAALDQQIVEKEALIGRLREEREKAIRRLSGAEAARDAAFRGRGETAARLEEADAALKNALSGTSFRDADDAEKALLEIGVEKTIEEEIRRWRENRAILETQIAEQEKQLNGIRVELSKAFTTGKIPGLEEAEGRLEALKTEREAAEDEKNSALAALTSLEKDREALEEATKRHESLGVEAAKYRALSDDLSGKNPRKLPFDSWLLGNYLEEAAAYATKRLEKMSESRYSLLLDTDRQGRGYAGLDLMVFDAHTGKTRPCATLSGGESFMASISLALGLADSIQNRSGGVRLDAVFIDEGFGSLDETSLDKALVILDELREHRMVGLISHVGELRSRIPCRIEVIKTGAGSKIAAG